MPYVQMMEILLTTLRLGLNLQDFVAINICENNFIDRFPSIANKFPFLTSNMYWINFMQNLFANKLPFV